MRGASNRSVKRLDRPPVVHLLKEITATEGVTKCGVAYKRKDKPPTLTTVWHSEVTCDECDPPRP